MSAPTARSIQRSTLPLWLTGRHAARRFIPIHTRSHGLPLPLVVALTSYPPRYTTLIHTLYSLLQQDMRPDALELWLADHEAAALPQQILDLRDSGLILCVAEDIRSYKKYVPVRAAHPDAIIVTADDDCYYRPSWLSDLVAAWRPGEQTILCHRGHRLITDPAGLPLPYGRWPRNVPDSGPDRAIFPIGVGGVLYPPGTHHPDVLDRDRFIALCPAADDVWLYWMALRAGSSFRKIGPRRSLVLWNGTQGTALWRANDPGGGNDLAVAAMIAAYGWPDQLNSAWASSG